MRNGYIIDTLTSVEIQEIVKIGGKKIEIYEGVIYRENFKKSPFRKVIENIFTLGQKNNDEKIDLMQGLVKLIMNSFYGVQIGKILTNHIIVSPKLGWKQKMIKMFWIYGDYQMELI